MGEERRRAERHPINLKVELDSGSGLTRDVSGLGVYFKTDVPFTVGDEIGFNLVIPDAVNVRCRGEVVRVIPENGGFGVGATIESYSVAEGESESDPHAHIVIKELKRHLGRSSA